MTFRIYIAGPYTKGDVAVNVRNAIQAADKLADLGFAPYVPHLTHFWHTIFPRPYDFWLELDNQYLPKCDAVLRIPGESSGADKEVQLATSLGIPVFLNVDNLVAHFAVSTQSQPSGIPTETKPNASPTTASSAQSGDDNKVRKDLVQVFFGLVLTQIAVYVTSLVRIWDVHSVNHWAALSHLTLAFVLTTSSWFGWQMAMKDSKFESEGSIFQTAYVLAVLDILMVGLYFFLVHKVELENVTAFPSSISPKVVTPSAWPEIVVLLLVFALYLGWDVLTYNTKNRSSSGKKHYGPWPSGLCLCLAGLCLVPRFQSISASNVILIDAYLICLIVFFRAVKRLQKQVHKANVKWPDLFSSAPIPKNVLWPVFSMLALGALSYFLAFTWDSH